MQFGIAHLVFTAIPKGFASRAWCLALFLAAAVGISSSLAVSGEISDRAVEVLREGLASEQFWPSMHAAEGLSTTGHADEVRKKLAGRLAGETDDQHRCGLARELVRAGDRSHVQVMLDILADKKTNGRTHAAESLFKVTEISDGALLRAAMREEDLRTSLMAAAALARCGSPAALEKIRENLSHTDPAIRMIVPWILRQVGDPSDRASLLHMVESESDPLLRSQAVHALARLGDVASRRQLIVNLSADDPNLRVNAAEAAFYLKPDEQLQQAVAHLLDDEDLDVRIRAAHAVLGLAGRGAEASGADVRITLFEATAEHPRWSEGSILPLRDGRLLFAVTRFIGGAADASQADIVARESADGGRTWGELRVLQENVGKRNVMSVTLRRLDLAREAQGPIGMFYLKKDGDSELNVYLRISDDEGQSFGPPTLVTDRPGYHVMNNDRVTVLASGRLLCPVSWTADQRQSNHYESLCFLSDDGGRSWRAGRGSVDLPKRGAMEPEVIELTDGRLLMIVRSQMGRIYAARSSDGGDTWSAPQAWGPPAPEAPSTLRRIPATGDLVLIWNDSIDPKHHHHGKRTPLTVAISHDGGGTWSHGRNLEDRPNEGYAYTSLAFLNGRALLSYYVARDGRISTRFRSLPVAWFYEASP